MNERGETGRGRTHTLLDTVGNTPLVPLRVIGADLPGRVFVKLENRNPLGSVKDRIGRAMVQDAAERGILAPGATIVEATSGNTGIALAWIGAHLGYRVVLVMPDTMSTERRSLFRALGARVELTDGITGMSGAVSRAEEIVRLDPGAVHLQQFANPANPAAHEQTTGPEIWEQTNGAVDAFVAGVGTGGTITGTGRALRRHNPAVELVAVEPAESAVLSQSRPGLHGIQGIGAGFVPAILDQSLLSGIETVSAEEAGGYARRLATEEGILAGISAGANVAVALRLAARREYEGKTIVTVVCDTGERYLSTSLYKEE